MSSHRLHCVLLCLGILIITTVAQAQPTEAFEVMADAGAVYINDTASCPGVLDASSLNDNLDNYTVIDIRSAIDYEAGHIPGAYHSSLITLLDDLATVIPTTRPYVIACYSGQTAGLAKIAMGLLGYNDIYTLLFGMSSWNSTLDVWSSHCADDLADPEVENQNGNLTVHEFPQLNGDPGTIVTERVNVMLASGFRGVNYTDIMDNLDDYFVINYFGEADYEGVGSSGVPGHIPGAYQFTPYASLAMDQMLANIPPDMPVVVYGWTGQHSAQITAYLNMLGYDAYSLKYGTNSLFYSSLTAHKWNADHHAHDFELETGGPVDPVFQAAADAVTGYLNDSSQCPGIISATTLHDNLDDFTVIDIRAETHFLAGHIPGAYSSSLATLLDDLATTIPNHKPYVLACYSGQSSGHAKVAMEMMEYDDVFSLKFGMSAWNSALDLWSSHCADNLATPETENQNHNLTVHDYPVLVGDPETIVAERVEQALAHGFMGRNYTDIMDNLDEYFIINYFGLADYEGTGYSGVPGHIPGAFQFTPYASLGLDQMLNNIPTDMPVIVYCWTGQHSSQVTFGLNMLGYETYSLNWGVNNLFHSDLTAHLWNEAQMHDYPLETGGPLDVPEHQTALVASLGNHPNPFNPATTIAYRLTDSARVTLRIYDMAGRLVRELAGHVEQSAGDHQLDWDGRGDAGQNLASGTYLYRLDADGQTASRSLTLLK